MEAVPEERRCVGEITSGLILVMDFGIYGFVGVLGGVDE